jgi:hypothetical protein
MDISEKNEKFPICPKMDLDISDMSKNGNILKKPFNFLGILRGKYKKKFCLYIYNRTKGVVLMLRV